MRRLIAGLFAALVGVGMARAQVAPLPIDPALDAYATPQRLVKLADGRRIHLYCQGRGSPTVILASGLGGWSAGWARVQPAIARQTRTCAWDRAGFGHSDASPSPQTVANTTADLKGALAAARIKGPYILVGHSAGAFETLLFADQHRRDVVGMVLVDPSVPGQPTRFASVAPDVARSNAVIQARNQDRQRACAAEVGAGTLKPDQPRWTSCFAYRPEFSPKAVALLKRLDDDASRLRTRISLSEQFDPNATAIASPSRDYGDLPLIVLTQGTGFPASGNPPEQVAAVNAGWIAWHDEYAKLSTRGINLIVRGSGHIIPLEKPQAVIAAIDAVVAAARQP